MEYTFIILLILFVGILGIVLSAVYHMIHGPKATHIYGRIIYGHFNLYNY